MGMRGPELRGVFHPVVGAGAEYALDVKGQGKSSMELTIVAIEQVNGKNGYWMEMGITNPSSGGTMYTKTLIVVDNQSVVSSRMIMQMPNGQPMEMDSQMMMRGNKTPQSADVRKDSERVGTEPITTPAGTFSCEHWRQKDGSSDYWLSEKVAPWGLVKLVNKSTTMTLQRLITGAKTHITGTPTKFDPMKMMGQRPQQEP
jgi:hypothetical protein